MATDLHGLWMIPCCHFSTFIYVLSFILVAFTLSSRFRFYIKYFCLMIYYCVLGAVIIPMTMLMPGSRNNVYKVSQLFQWTDVVWGMKYNIIGQENYKEGTNYVIVSNHQSSFDMHIVMNFVPKRTTFVAKRDILFIPVIGIIFWLSGIYLINRRNRNEAVSTMKNAAEAMKKDKFNLWIFPEGTRHMGNKLLPFKKGAFHLAQQTQLPILPVVISNYEHIINFRKHRFSSGSINLTILPAVSTTGLKPGDVDNLLQKLYSIMSKEYEK